MRRGKALGRAEQLDPLQDAASRRVSKQEPSDDELRAAHRVYAQHVKTGAWDEGFHALSDFVARYPHIVRFQILAARFLEAAQRHEQAWLAWQGIQQRFPDSDEAFLLGLSSLKKHRGQTLAGNEVELYFSSASQNYHERMLEARAWEVVGNDQRAEDCFAALTKLHPEQEDAYIRFVAFHIRLGNFQKAWEVARQGHALLGSGARKLADRYAELSDDLSLLKHIAGADRVATVRASNLVLEYLLQSIHQRRLEFIDDQPPSYLGAVLMINSSLGAGGAERQFVNTAIALQQAMRSGQAIAGYDVLGPIEVCCRSLTKKKGADFFAPSLEREGVTVSAYSEFALWGGCEERSIVAEYKALLKFLPSSMADGVIRLADVLRANSPSVVHIWQDGSIFATVLAALMADVPRIVLSVRTLPPTDRPDRYQPEYEVLYPALVRMPGVVLNANSSFAARRYAKWIGVDERVIPVVYNGLEPFSGHGSRASRALLDDFLRRTPDATRTIGTVMRIDENKRPFLWLDAARRFLEDNPGTRFIIVGDGPLRLDAEGYAQRLGIDGKVLFTGLSDEVGFWLSAFDIFLLLSRFEGLPNVLIEAQFSGVPVVTTLAGGAGEALLPSKTGITLKNDDLRVEDVCLALKKVCAMRDSDPTLPRQATEFATNTFSIQQMVSATVHSYLGWRRISAAAKESRYENAA